MTWGDVYWRWKHKGADPSDAAHHADEYERRMYQRYVREMEARKRAEVEAQLRRKE